MIRWASLRSPIKSSSQEFHINLYFVDSNDKTYDEPLKSIDAMMAGWFKFVQTEDGSITAVFHSKTEDSQAVNFKKTIASAFQANFEGTTSKVEADPQSLHTAKYTYVFYIDAVIQFVLILW